MSFNDLFSDHADDYARHRPTYPKELFAYLASLTPSHQAAFDCGTGNGQGAIMLAPYFEHVYASDPSQAQIDKAPTNDNISYHVATAEQCPLPDQSVSLISVFQALHWFDLKQFSQEVLRILTEDGILAIIGYHRAITELPEVDTAYQDFNYHYLWQQDCWAKERLHLINDYQTLELPIEEQLAPSFYIDMHWNYQDYLAYINTWSAVKTHIKRYGTNPVDTVLAPAIQAHWPNPEQARRVRFPLVIRVGSVLPAS